MRVEELAGVELDYWTAKAAGYKANIKDEKVWIDQLNGHTAGITQYSPTTNWNQFGDLVLRYNIATLRGKDIGNDHGIWEAQVEGPVTEKQYDGFYNETGTDPRIAGCRTLVYSVYGREYNYEDKE